MVHLRRYCFCIILIVTAGLVLCLSSCMRTAKTDSDGNYQSGAYLENMDNGVCRQHPSGLMWQAGNSPQFTKWEDADEYVKSLKLGGFEDWRMPTPDECLGLSKLIQTKKGDCPMETGKAHWVMKSKNIATGQWESNVLCDGPIFRWTADKRGTVKAVRP